MLEDAKYMNGDEANVRIARMVVWAILGIFLIFFTTTSGCVMYINSVSAEQTQAETEQIKERGKVAKIKSDAISALIGRGTNPIAARCAIHGYTIMIANGQVVNPCLQFLNNGDELK